MTYGDWLKILYVLFLCETRVTLLNNVSSLLEPLSEFVLQFVHVSRGKISQDFIGLCLFSQFQNHFTYDTVKQGSIKFVSHLTSKALTVLISKVRLDWGGSNCLNQSSLSARVGLKEKCKSCYDHVMIEKEIILRIRVTFFTKRSYFEA